MASLKDLTPYVANSFPMASDLLIVQQLARAARTMCAESYCWKYETTFDTVVGQQDYTYTLPADSERIRIDNVWINEEQMTPIAWDELLYPKYDPEKTGRPTHFSEKIVGELSLWPIPQQIEEVKIRLSLMPTLNATTFDDSLQAQHGQTLSSGAMSYLMLMPGKVWSDAQGGILYNEMFIQGVNRARTKARDGSTKRIRMVNYGGI